ncbi:glycosyltransferase, partial [Clostridium perfringens]|nr:glycosyltransferase [Clostridium perfringens]
MERDNIEIVHNALNLKRFREPPHDKAELRRSLGFPVEDVLVGHIGRFNPPKNHRFLLQVFREFLRQQPSAKLILAGDGPLRPESEAWVKEQGIEESVYFLGVREDVPDILRAMDMFLFPSLYEGFGLSIMEAQAAGLPCMIS